jgi:hypothetical protein
MAYAQIDLNRVDVNLRKYQVKSVLPEHFTDDYPMLISFLEGYYNNAEEDDTLSVIRDLQSVFDIERTSLDNLEYLFGMIADGANSGYFSDPREVLRNFAQFYRVKGTKYSAEGFFRAFFAEDIQIEHPKDNLFIVGESQIGTESLRFIQNGALYQIFSVLIKSSIPISGWRELYKKFVHPAGFFLGGQVVLELPSTNSLLNAMPENVPAPPPPLTIVGAATLAAPFGLSELIGKLPDDEDSDSRIEYISLAATAAKFADMPAEVFMLNYARIDKAMHVNSPRMSDDTYSDDLANHGIRMSNHVETMDQNTYTHGADSG